MKSPLLIALRFFLDSKRSMLLSTLGVVFGVGFFIAGQAQTQGFETFFVDTILGTKGAVIVSDRIQTSYTRMVDKSTSGLFSVQNQRSTKYFEGIKEPLRLISAIEKYPNVKACSPVIEKSVKLKTAFGSEVATMLGIELESHVRATDFESQIIAGSLNDFRSTPDALAVGATLAEKLDLHIGQVISVEGNGAPRRFKITNLFETGISNIDDRRVYCHLRAARSVLKMPFTVSYIMVQLDDATRAQANAKAFLDLLKHNSRAWQDREKGNLQIFATLRISAGLGISCIIMLAGFSIFNILTMSVLEKTKEIAILRSMGYTRGDISSIFVFQGMALAFIGILIGWGVGAALTFGISNIPIKIRGIFKADHFIVEWSFEHYLLAAVLAVVSVFIASYIPALRAARVDPVNILRGTSH